MSGEATAGVSRESLMMAGVTGDNFCCSSSSSVRRGNSGSKWRELRNGTEVGGSRDTTTAWVKGGGNSRELGEATAAVHRESLRKFGIATAGRHPLTGSLAHSVNLPWSERSGIATAGGPALTHSLTHSLASHS